MKLALILLCGVAALLARAPEAAAQKAATAAAPAVIKHGGKIEMKYDGFNLETVVALRKMQVTCGSGKGFKD
ncbi:MAG TPA: hypothetical protein VF240_05705, partial [Pyrinomonadaceae bacterium]